MLQLRDIPTGENSQGDKSLNLLSYLKTVSISLKKFGLKKSKSWSQKFGLKKSLGIGLENIWSRKKVSVSVSKKSLSIGLENIWS